MSGSDQHAPPPRASFARPEGEAPVLRCDHGWVVEFRVPSEGPVAEYERAGGLVRVRGIAVLRHPHGDVEQPLEIVMHQDDATAMAASILGRVRALWQLVAGAIQGGVVSFLARLSAPAHGGPRARPRSSGPRA